MRAVSPALAGVVFASLVSVDAQSLFVLPAAIASKYGAACLDGSPPAVYFRPGTSPSKWTIHFRGGGWCTSPLDCYWRTTLNYDNLGSSTQLPAVINTTDNAIYGLMSNRTDSPDGDRTLALLMYCDGTSWSGNRDEPLVYNGTSMWFRGRRNLDAMLEFLQILGGLRTAATDVIITGTSAGGLATYMHAEYIRSQLPANASVVAMPDAGFFLDHANAWGVYAYRQTFAAAVNESLWNATYDGTNTLCLAAMPSDQLWKCFFAQYVYGFNPNVPFFILNSLYDPAQIQPILQLNCEPGAGTCNATELSLIEAYRRDEQSAITSAVATYGGRDGFFLTACNQHEESCRDFDWFGITVGGLTPNSSFTAWRSGAPSSAFRVIDTTWPGDASCQPYGAHHGGC